MSGQALVDRLKKRFGDKIVDSNLTAIDPWIVIAPHGLVEICQFLKTDAEWQLNMINCITVVDFFEPDPKKAAKTGWEPHLEVVYHLSSIQKKHSLVLKVNLPRWKDNVAGEIPDCPSVVSVWRGADWHEREVFDLSGINFVGHPDLKRILCPEDWVGYPLRKDYEMPLEYHGIRGR
jgi:NADH-quinone oxidoreductase subunit C